MPLSSATATTIGSVSLTDTAAAGGVVCYVDVEKRFLDLVGRPRLVATATALDNRQRADTVARVLKGRCAWTVRNCPPTLTAALIALVGTGLQTAAIYHPAVVSPLALLVEVLGVDLTDSQDVASDPTEDLVLDLLIHGAP